MFKQMMQPYQRTDFQLVGEFLYVERCTGTVLIQTDRGEYRLKQGAQVIDPKLAGRLTIENLGGAGEIELISGYGRYVPPADGQQVSVEKMPALEMAAGQSMNVAVTEQPAMQLAPNQAVNVDAMPPMALAENQNVAVSALPKVQLATGQVVRVTATTPLLTKPTGGSELTATHLTVTANSASLAANTRRCHAVVKAKATNVAEVMLAGGFSLAAGEKQKIEATCELTFSGTDGDIIEIYEVVR
ncbi:hypothetical protein [Photobacterium sanguinicancri]|uniref:hypothetical protein n=1 Tax=Photobacterium sanguinicancri TaxID=875932 RepID=UPI0026E1C96B|nr:hypothetical protein [Photobacterium sanguinicancri]MDO6496834.1 hypothetical protein [Photobacterium sanguinicancri]